MVGSCNALLRPFQDFELCVDSQVCLNVPTSFLYLLLDRIAPLSSGKPHLIKLF